MAAHTIAQLNEKARVRINTAVAEAERRCAAEVVPVVARTSGRYDRAEDVFGVLVALLVFCACWLLFQREDPAAGGWGGLPLTLQLPVLVGILLVGFVAGTILATQFPVLSRPFISRRHLDAAVAARAAQVFFDHRISHTRAATGVLIYISLFEKRAMILADKAARDGLTQDGLDALRDQLLTDLKSHALPDALIATIRELGKRLAEPLPPAPGTERNELPDALIVVGRVA